MKLFILFTIFFLSSCATNKVVKRTFEDPTDIKEEDFKPVTLVPYTKRSDTYAFEKEEKHSILLKESLERTIKYDEDFGQLDTLGTVIASCYEKNFQKAKVILQKMTRTHHKNPMFWNTAGICASLEGERRKALLLFNKALSFRSGYAPAYNNLGVMYVNESDYSRALVAFEKAKKLGSLSRTPRFNLANLYLYFGLYDQAIQNISSLIQVNTNDVAAVKLMATAYLMKNDVGSSLKYFEMLDSSSYTKEDVGINYSLALFLSGKVEKSHDVLDDVELTKNNNWGSYYSEIKNIIGVK